MDVITRRRGLLRRRTIVAAAAALTMSAGLAACGGGSDSSSASGEGTSVKVGVIPIIDVAPIYLGIKKGFFKDEGLNLKLETAQGGAAIVPGVVSGQYQFGFSNTTSLLLAGDKGLKLSAVTAGVSSTGKVGKDFGAVVVPGNSPIKSAKDLAGKKVAVNTLNNINTTTINEVVRADGGDPSGIKYVELPFPDIASAVAKGDVDAGQVVEPFLTIATQQGDRQVASNYAGTDPDLEVGMYFTSQNYAKGNAKVVEEFTTAMNKSLSYSQSHPAEARAILSDYTDLNPKVQKAVTLPRWSPKIATESVTKLGELSVTDGLLKSQPDVDALLP